MIIEQLIDECSNNNTKAQEQVYRLLAPKLFSVCLKYSRNYEEAQDNLQENIEFDKTIHGHKANVIGNESLQAIHIKLSI